MGYVVIKYDLSGDIHDDTQVLGIYKDLKTASLMMLGYFTKNYFDFVINEGWDEKEEGGLILQDMDYSTVEIDKKNYYTELYDGVFSYKVLPYEVEDVQM